MDGNRGRFHGLLGRAWDQVRSPLYRNAFFIMSSSVIGSGLGFFFWIVVYRIYSKADVAVAVALIQTITFVGALAHFGLGTATIRFLPETEDKPSLINACLTIVGLAGLGLAVVFVLGIEIWADKLRFVWDSPIYWVAILSTAMALALTAILDQAAFAMRRAEALPWRTTIYTVLKIPFAVGLAAFALTKGRLGVFLALAFPAVIAVAWEGFLFLPRVVKGFRPWPTLDWTHVRPMVVFGLGNYTANSIGSAAALLLPLLILQVIGTDPVNYYYVASVVAGLLSIIPGAVFTSFYAEASQRGARRHEDERRALRLSLALLIPAIAVMWFFAGLMLRLFGDPAFADGAVGALRILVFSSIPALLNSLYVTRVRVRKKTAPIIVGAVIGAALTFGLGYPLLLSNGIEGLALAVTAANFAVVPYYWFVARRSFEGEEEPPTPVAVE